MDRNFGDRRNNGRNFRNRKNYGRNVQNDKRNHERNSRMNKYNKEQRNVVNELREELNEAFVKGLDITEEKLENGETRRSESVVEFDSTNLN